MPGICGPRKAAAPIARQRRENDGSVILDLKAMEGMLWKAACSIRGEKDAPKFKDYILPLLFIKRLSDVFEDEVATLARTYGNEALAREVLEADHSLVRFYVAPFATWPVISGRQPYDWPENDKPKTLGERLTTATRAIARENPRCKASSTSSISTRPATASARSATRRWPSHRDLQPAPLPPRPLNDVEPDFLGRAYEYLLRKFAEGQGQSAGEFFHTVGSADWFTRLSREPSPGEDVYDLTCGSAGLLVERFRSPRTGKGRRARGQAAVEAVRPGADRIELRHRPDEHGPARHGGRDRPRQHDDEPKIP